MQRVHEISTSQSSSNSQSNQQKSDDSLQEDSNIEPHLDVAESKIPVDQNSQSEQTDLSANIDNEDWDIASFVHLNKFLDLSTSIMPAVVLYKNAASLEEYKYYGFIIDVLDYAIAQGSKFLSINSDSEIRKYYQGGRAELENIIVSYRHLREDQVVLSPSDIQTDTNDDVEEQPYIRPDNS